MSPRLGISVAAREVRAVLVSRRRVVWAGHAAYEGTGQLAERLAQLAGETPVKVRRARVVLERDVVQLRTLAPAPRLPARAVRRHVHIEARLLFRENGSPLVTDGRMVRGANGEQALLAAAASAGLLDAIAAGCEQAGIALDALGAASEVLPLALRDQAAQHDVAIPTGLGAERLELVGGGVWRSRLIRDPPPAPAPWSPRLAALGEQASRFAPAFAACLQSPKLNLLPPDTTATRAKRARARLRQLIAVAAALWVGAAVIQLGRLGALRRAAERELAMLAPAAESAMALRRELHLTRHALATLVAAQRQRSRTLPLLADLTRVLGDSVMLASLQVSQDSTVRMAGVASQAGRVLTAIQQLGRLREARFEGPVTREQDRDRFTIVARGRQP